MRRQELAHEPEGLQQDDAAARPARLRRVDAVVLVVERQRPPYVHGVIAEIGERHLALASGDRRALLRLDDRLGDLPLVESVGAVTREHPESLCEVGLEERRAVLTRLAV